MKQTSRRSFLVNTATIAAMYPLVNSLKGCGPEANFALDTDAALRIINRNGKNLAFYFINVVFKGRDAIPQDGDYDSYMIVQIPPQSLHEEYVNTPPPFTQVNAKLARHSYLAFRIWPKIAGANRKMRMSPETLLNWKNDSLFKFLTTSDMKRESFKSFSTLQQVEDSFVPSSTDDIQSLGLNYYEKVLGHLFHRAEHGDQYISLFELPAELYLVPHINKKDVQAKIIQNDYKISKQEYTVTNGSIRFKRLVQERWNAELKFDEKITGENGISYNELPPVLRAIGLRNAKIPTENRPDDPCVLYTDNNKYLPTLLDKVELVYLNQVYHGTYENSSYDIRVNSKLLVTSTGASLKFHYKNFVTGDKNISLAEYEHHFQDGRDNYIKVARIGVIAPYGLKALHVRIAARKIIGTVSVMEMKHYIEIIEPLKNYPVKRDDEFFNVSDIEYKTMFSAVTDGMDESRNKTFYHRHPFTGIIPLLSRTPPIKAPATECELFFWVYKEGNTETTEDLLSVPFKGYDRNKQEFNTTHPVLFIRKDFFSQPLIINSFLGSGNPANAYLATQDDGRLKIPLNNQIISYTPDDPEAVQDEQIKNKINQLPSEYVEYYVNIAQYISPANKPDLFDNVSYIIYPQMRRAKVFVEQIQQYSRIKLPSVITYPIDFLDHEFDREKNKAKLVLKHTKDFLDGVLQNLGGTRASVEKDLEQGYQRIKDVFSKAEDKIGGLVNPDVEIERFALVKEALTLPVNINTQWERVQERASRVLNTAEILKGKSAEILGGIDLKMLLEEVLGVEQSPQFDLNKITGVINDIDKFLNEFKNETVGKVIQAVRNTDRVIKEALSEVNKAQDEIKRYQEILTNARKLLHDRLNDVSHIRNAARLLFEQQRMRFIDEIEATAIKIEDHIRSEIAGELSKITGRVEAVNETINAIAASIDYKVGNAATGFITSLRTVVANLPANDDLRKNAEALALILEGDPRTLLDEFKGQINTILTLGIPNVSNFKYYPIASYFNADIICGVKNGKYYIHLPAIGDKTRIRWEQIEWTKVVYTESDFSDPAVFGFEQLKQVTNFIQAMRPPAELVPFINRLNTLLSENANSAYEKANKTYTEIAAKYNVIVTALPPNFRKELDELLKLIDTVRRSTTKFYIERYNELKKDYMDIRAKLGPLESLLPTVKELYVNRQQFFSKMAETFNAEAKAYADHIVAGNIDAIQVQAQRLNSKIEEFGLLLDKQINDFILNNNDLASVQVFVKDIKKYQELLENPERGIRNLLKEKEAYYKKQLELQARSMFEQLETRFREELAKINNTDEVIAAKREYQKLLSLLQSIRTQELKYTWTTDKFRKANIGIIRFTPDTNPKTRLTVDVKSVIHIDPLRLPPVIEKVEASAVNMLTNFNVTFLSVLTVGFTKVEFVTGTGASPKLTVKIRDVKFDGALSFIQKLEELLKSLGEGFKLEINPTGVGIAYFMPIPSISSPGFTFANISIGVQLNIYFDRQPMTVKFMLAHPEDKAIIAAGILGGGFYCGLTADPKRGLRQLQMALDMGAYLGMNIGPIRGEVKLMVGLFYQKDSFGVVLEGYVIAVGTLSVWIISVSGEIKLSVRSQNSYVEGSCTVTYSAKLGFIKKSFSGTFRKKIAGATSQRQETRVAMNAVLVESMQKGIAAFEKNSNTKSGETFMSFSEYLDEQQYQVMTKNEWINFYKAFYQ